MVDRLMRSLPWLVVMLLVGAFSQQASTNNPANKEKDGFEPTSWLEDFRQLQSEMTVHYANLESAVQERRMDLPALRKATEEKLRNAKNEREAQLALEKFIDSFGDGHFEIRWATPVAQAAPAANPTPSNVCEKLNYVDHLKPGLDLSALPEFRTIESEDAKTFPGGLLRLADGRLIGTIRIGLFTEHSYPEVCEQAAKALHLADKTECDENCADKLEIETANMLTAALSRQAEALRNAGATALLIDITRNGGGSDWVDAAARELSSVPLRSSRMAFLKHPHWTQTLQQELDNVEADLKQRRQPQNMLQDAAATLRSAIQETAEPCKPAQVWETGKLSCSMLVRNRRFASGVLEYAKPGSLGAFESKTILFHPLRYTYTESANRLPLYVLVDRETWSSAEYFAAIIQDNRAATIVGEATGGAGCGYTNGGIPTRLKNSGAEVKMPDCVRLRADGSNEVNGIIPDIVVAWPNQASNYQRAVKVASLLANLSASRSNRAE